MFGIIHNPHGELLEYDFLPGEEERKELVVIGHGVTANKDREWAITLANALASAGIASLRFSFSGNGGSEGRFEDSCPSKEADDLRAVLEATGNWQVTYVGHSMGAAVGVLVASTDVRIFRMVSLGGMVDTADFAQRKFGEQEPDASFMWEKPECPLSQIFLDDMMVIGSVEPLAKSISIPWLLVHGEADSVVPPEESERLAEQATSTRTLMRMSETDHVFSGTSAAIMAKHVVTWLHAH